MEANRNVPSWLSQLTYRYAQGQKFWHHRHSRVILINDIPLLWKRSKSSWKFYLGVHIYALWKLLTLIILKPISKKKKKKLINKTKSFHYCYCFCVAVVLIGSAGATLRWWPGSCHASFEPTWSPFLSIRDQSGHFQPKPRQRSPVGGTFLAFCFVLFLLPCLTFVPKSHDPDTLITPNLTNQYQWNAPII